MAAALAWPFKTPASVAAKCYRGRDLLDQINPCNTAVDFGEVAVWASILSCEIPNLWDMEGDASVVTPFRLPQRCVDWFCCDHG